MSELQQFVAELLEERGAAVEPVEPEGLDVLEGDVPSHVANLSWALLP